jgi:thiamine-monophosphate kinase
MRERDFIDWICSQSDFDPAIVPVGPGDDMAVVVCNGTKLLLATDQVLDGVHVVIADHGAESVGRKVMARNLSDVAAMAATPFCAVASVGLPTQSPQGDAEALYAGLRTIADAYGCLLVGGDMGSWEGPLCVSVSILAHPASTGPILRSGARPGDILCVTGAFGASWRTRRHLEFAPRVEEAKALAAGFDLHAMIDVSDGLAIDLGRLCGASGVGANLEGEAIPIHPDAHAMCADPLLAALTDGEDYELLFALPEPDADALLARPPFDIPVTRIGEIIASPDRTLTKPDGSRSPLPTGGWEHETR